MVMHEPNCNFAAVDAEKEADAKVPKEDDKKNFNTESQTTESPCQTTESLRQTTESQPSKYLIILI